jgi:hypothetical protein
MAVPAPLRGHCGPICRFVRGVWARNALSPRIRALGSKGMSLWLNTGARACQRRGGDQAGLGSFADERFGVRNAGLRWSNIQPHISNVPQAKSVRQPAPGEHSTSGAGRAGYLPGLLGGSGFRSRDNPLGRGTLPEGTNVPHVWPVSGW